MFMPTSLILSGPRLNSLFTESKTFFFMMSPGLRNELKFAAAAESSGSVFEFVFCYISPQNRRTYVCSTIVSFGISTPPAPLPNSYNRRQHRATTHHAMLCPNPSLSTKCPPLRVLRTTLNSQGGFMVQIPSIVRGKQPLSNIGWRPKQVEFRC